MAAATQILDEYEKVMIKPEMTDDEKKATEETYNHRSADVARCWVKYALNLMSDSRERLLEEQEVSSKQKYPVVIEFQCLYVCVFFSKVSPI